MNFESGPEVRRICSLASPFDRTERNCRLTSTRYSRNRDSKLIPEITHLRVWPSLIMTLRFSPRQLQLIDPCPARSAIVTAKTSSPSLYYKPLLPLLAFSCRSYPFNYADPPFHRRCVIDTHPLQMCSVKMTKLHP